MKREMLCLSAARAIAAATIIVAIFVVLPDSSNALPQIPTLDKPPAVVAVVTTTTTELTADSSSSSSSSSSNSNSGGIAYDNKFDNIDLDEVLAQERLLVNYIKCLEGQGPCTPDARMLKDILPDAIMTDCLKCTEKQRYGSEKVTRYLIDNRPKDWQRLEKIYDPQATYRIKYQEAKNEKIEPTMTMLDVAQGDD